MLKSTVRLSRHVHRSNRTDRYSICLSGEIPFAPDDAEGVIEKIAELFALADEALAQEIEKSRDDQPAQPHQPGQKVATQPSPSSNGQRPENATSSRTDPVTSKQLQYMLNLGKRKGLSHGDLDSIIAQAVGSPKKTGDLTKREAGQIIDHLTNLKSEATK